MTEIVGKSFGKLNVIRINRRVGTATFYLCRCSCGITLEIARYLLTGGKCKSCGCGPGTHRLTNAPEYTVWRSMKKRCYCKNDKSYPTYGGRGISVCERWLHSFENFYSDMGPRPSKNHSIDRIRNWGNYEPENCRWATLEVQNSNRGKPISHGGVTMAVRDWSKKLGIKRCTIDSRIRKGWPTDRIFSPVNGDVGSSAGGGR